MLPIFRPIAISALLSGCLLFPQLAHAMNYVIGVSPYLQPEQAKQERRIISQTLITSLEPGDQALVVDAYNLRTITRFVVPNQPIYRNPKIKLKANSAAVIALNRSAAGARLPKGGTEPQKPGAIKFPEFMRFVANTAPGQPLDVLVFGSPLYPSASGFSMESGLIPGDGHLNHPVGTTPFGIDNPKALQGKRIYWYTGGTNWSLHEQHKWHVERIWSLFCSRQGGVLASFQEDLPSVLNSMRNHRTTPQNRYAPAAASKKLEMIRLRPPQLKTGASIYERPISRDKPPVAMVTQARNVEFGIRWQCNDCDLDLYVRPTPSSKTLYFSQTQSEYGTYLKDYRSSPRHFFESVQLTRPVDLRQTLVAVNYFSSPLFGTAGPVTGELRVSWQGRTYRKAFTLSATRGNAGWDRQELMRTGRAPSAHWVVFNLPDIVGL